MVVVQDTKLAPVEDTADMPELDGILNGQKCMDNALASKSTSDTTSQS